MVEGTTVTTALTAFLARDGREVPILSTPRVQHALEVANVAYAGRVHWSGESLEWHVAGVLNTFLSFRPDEDAIIGCILHHVLQTEQWSLVQLEEEFGHEVRTIVSGAHLLSHVTVRDRRSSIQDLRLMLLTVAEDMRTILISLCDYCYLLDCAEELPPAERRRLAEDVLALFAPVAARLGIYVLKQRLEERAFPILYPADAERIHRQICTVKEQQGDFLPIVRKQLVRFLHEKGIDAEIFARCKQRYSIFLKMRQKSLTHVNTIHDFYALRIVVNSIEECYQVLGLLHQGSRPIAQRFKDYISFPKPNGYQSLHTTLVHVPGAPEDVMMEVQIRTHAMHREAEYGIAAHWSYKEVGSTKLAVEHAQLHRMLSSQELLESEQGQQQLVDHIFVLTPKGDVIELPEGATPLDFAFHVHTDVGLSFRGARVNGTMVPIDHELENGDVVEIVRNAAARPSPQWFQLLKVASARSKLRRYLNAQARPELIIDGRNTLNALLRERKLPLLDADLSQIKYCDGKILSFQEREDLLMKIGQGAERAASLLTRADALRSLWLAREADANSCPLPDAYVSSPTENKAVEFEDGLPMPTRYAQCCKPEGGVRPPIVGVINRTGTVMVHRASCRMLKNMNPERRLAVRWSTGAHPQPFPLSSAT